MYLESISLIHTPTEFCFSSHRPVWRLRSHLFPIKRGWWKRKRNIYPLPFCVWKGEWHLFVSPRQNAPSSSTDLYGAGECSLLHCALEGFFVSDGWSKDIPFSSFPQHREWGRAIPLFLIDLEQEIPTHPFSRCWRRGKGERACIVPQKKAFERSNVVKTAHPYPFPSIWRGCVRFLGRLDQRSSPAFWSVMWKEGM